MNTKLDNASSPDLAEEVLSRTTAPAAHGHDAEHEHHDHEHAFEWPEMLRIGLVAVAAAGVWWRLWEPFPSVSLISVAGLAVGGWPIYKEALENLLAKRMTNTPT